MKEWEREAHGVARAVRGCTTDDQYTELVVAIEARLIDAYTLGYLARAKEDWQPVETLPEWGLRPPRQFIYVEGDRFHSDARWRRAAWGLACIRNGEQGQDSWHGYRMEDMKRIAEDGDMDLYSMRVTHWMPARLPVPEGDPNG